MFLGTWSNHFLETFMHVLRMQMFQENRPMEVKLTINSPRGHCALENDQE